MALRWVLSWIQSVHQDRIFAKRRGCTVDKTSPSARVRIQWNPRRFENSSRFMVHPVNVLERRDPRDVLADDQGMDVVGAFVGFDRLQVGHVAEDGVLVGDAVGAEDVASYTGAL